jgi:hypothetical protein
VVVGVPCCCCQCFLYRSAVAGLLAGTNIPDVVNVPFVAGILPVAVVSVLAVLLTNTLDYQSDGQGLILFSAIEISIIRLLTVGNYRTFNYLTKESNYWTIDYSNQKKSFDVQFCPLGK